MNQHTIKSLTPLLLAAALPFLNSCSSTSSNKASTEKAGVKISTTSTFKEGVPGGTLLETYKFTATVTRIDPQMRTVTLLAPDGTYATFKAGPQSATFARLATDQRVEASVARELIVFLGKAGAPATEGPTAAAALAAKDGTSDVFVTKWLHRDAVVAAVDQKQRLVALTFSDGTSKTFPVRKDVDMAMMKNGDDVVILIGSAATLSF